MSMTTTDPRTGVMSTTALQASTPEQVAAAVSAASDAWRPFASAPRGQRAALLDALADALEAHRDELVAIADSETGLGQARLTGEVGRSAFQFRLFAQAVRDGGYLEATIDHAGDTPIGPGPDLRRLLVPLGPVAVFGASNFPFAFSVAGGDTASALAAGCPVVAKAHPSHPLTSERSHQVLSEAALAAGAPAGLLGIVHGTQAGLDLVTDPRICAVGFTGSLGAAQALMTAIEGRDRPIPLYGELSSINPLIVTPAAAAARPHEIADGLFASVTMGSGQFCTKPGLAFIPRTGGDAVVDRLRQAATDAGAMVMLNDRIASSFDTLRDGVVAAGASVIAAGSAKAEPGFRTVPTVLSVDAADLNGRIAEEVFGPLVVVVRYDDLSEVPTALQHVPDSLTATVHSEATERDEVRELVAEVALHAGRVVFDGYPTGVRVAWAQHHGGGWPATNSIHTSVGVSAMRRFLRPFVFQDAPAELLPAELRDGPVDVPRRVDGVLELGNH